MADRYDREWQEHRRLQSWALSYVEAVTRLRQDPRDPKANAAANNAAHALRDRMVEALGG